MRYKVTLNNKVYEVEVEEASAMLVDEYEALAPVAPAAAPVAAAAPAAPVAAAPAAAPTPVAAAAGEQVTAPMPGTILKVNVTQGAAVKKGDILVVLEAMKMENEILAPKDGTVAQIAVSKGATVDTGALLAVIA
ncbi:MAG: biotin/lipoyl-binding protein [Clostridia bacterium]|nr:biotin/lipoyl-binding protein [Clostridia bacterium]